ncbi:hypothetical protein QBC46DRAFT_421290 [Diplogelasinospora grovesii]|uniref:BZIP domain-containing protein n=1 Tax=Diplogelasinospora grovesii TaxID=303347 RepID=A0AAN6S0R3_9PEZI|nr:hypothetical protein QBC46DRAFT_421290 [Diplogelasinospora grovesii]
MPKQTARSGSDDWANVQDLQERRRIQNRLAQRNYRMHPSNRCCEKLKKRIEDLERKAKATRVNDLETSSSESTHQQQTPTTNLPDDQETLPDDQETSSSSESTHQQQMPTTNLTPILTAPGPTLQTAPMADMTPLKSNLSETGSADYFSFQPSATPGLGSIPNEAPYFPYHQHYSIPASTAVHYVQSQSGYTPVGMPSYHSPRYMGRHYQGQILPMITTFSDIPIPGTNVDNELYTDFSFPESDPSECV